MGKIYFSGSARHVQIDISRSGIYFHYFTAFKGIAPRDRVLHRSLETTWMQSS